MGGQYLNPPLYGHYLGLDATKTVFGVSVKVKFNPTCPATQTSQKIEISLIVSLDMILFNKRIIKALISLRECAGLSASLLFANPRRQVISRRGPSISNYKCSERQLHDFFRSCNYLLWHPELQVFFLLSVKPHRPTVG